MILITCVCLLLVCVYSQGAWYSGLGSVTLPAAAAGHQRETRPIDSARRRPHPHRQPETRARKLSFPEGGVLPGCQGLLYGSGYANHKQQRYSRHRKLNLFIEKHYRTVTQESVATADMSTIFMGRGENGKMEKNRYNTHTHTCIRHMKRSVWWRLQTHFTSIWAQNDITVQLCPSSPPAS